MSRPTNYFTHLASVRVQYGRPPLGVYGETGQNYKFYCQKDFEDELDDFVEAVKTATEPLLGTMELILSAGAYVKKSKLHGAGRAFDLDAIHWARGRLVADQQPSQKPLYLLVQSIAYQHFGMVLAYNYNAAHRDHFHLDNSRPVQFRETKAATYFMQEALNLFYGANLVIDGDYGINTEDALVEVYQALSLNFPPNADEWKTFLKAVEGEALGLLHMQEDTGPPVNDDVEEFIGSPAPEDLSEQGGSDNPLVLATPADTGAIDRNYQPEPGWQVFEEAGTPRKMYLKRTGKPDLYLGYDFTFGTYRGLARTGRVSNSLFYNYTDYEAQHGLWAAFLTPTGMCESEGNFFVVNAWDSAAFTLGFFQMAAHTGEHLADLFRDLLDQLPDEAGVYFPELKLGHQIGKTGSERMRLYTVNGTDTLDLDEAVPHPDGIAKRSYDRGRFMAFFNGHRARLEMDEAVAAARWIAWLQGSPAARNVIVDNAVALSKRAVSQIHDAVLKAKLPNLPNGLDGAPMSIVQAAMDVKHHGRRNRDKGMTTIESILHSLATKDPLKSFRYIDTGWREDRSRRSVSEIGKMKPVFDGKVLNVSKMIFE